MDEQKQIQKQIGQILANTPKISDAKIDISRVWCMLEELKLELDAKNTKALSRRRHVGIQASPKNIYLHKYDAETRIINSEKGKNGLKINNRKKAIITPYASAEKSSWAANKVANDVLAKFFESSSQQSSSSLSTHSKAFIESSDTNTLVYRDKLLQKWLKQHANAHSTTLTTSKNGEASNNLDKIDAVNNDKVHHAAHFKRHKHHHHKKHATHNIPTQNKSLFQLPFNPTMLSTTPSSSSNDSLLSFVYHKRWPIPIAGPKSSDSNGQTSSSLVTGTIHSTSPSSDEEYSTESENPTLGKNTSTSYTLGSENIVTIGSDLKDQADTSLNPNVQLSQHTLTTTNATSRTYSTTSESSSDHTVRSADLRKTRRYRKSLKKELRILGSLEKSRAQGTQTTEETGSVLSSLTSSSTPSFESANTQFT